MRWLNCREIVAQTEEGTHGCKFSPGQEVTNGANARTTQTNVRLMLLGGA